MRISQWRVHSGLNCNNFAFFCVLVVSTFSHFFRCVFFVRAFFSGFVLICHDAEFLLSHNRDNFFAAGWNRQVFLLCMLFCVQSQNPNECAPSILLPQGKEAQPFPNHWAIFHLFWLPHVLRVRSRKLIHAAFSKGTFLQWIHYIEHHWLLTVN